MVLPMSRFYVLVERGDPGRPISFLENGTETGLGL